jgi:hypothetical protein
MSSGPAPKTALGAVTAHGLRRHEADHAMPCAERKHFLAIAGTRVCVWEPVGEQYPPPHLSY